MSYQTFGFGLNLVTLKNLTTPIGICGLLKRDELKYPDLGYALLPEFFSQGYAKEAALAVLQNSRTHQYINIISAITLPDNVSSNNLLNKLGFVLKDSIHFYGCDNNYYEYKP
jgi:RimJ/RimL family protein N-acetyltransferase